jgi:15-cis-phytoene synthase
MTIDGPMDPELRAAYDACRRIHRRADPTYYLATRRLPRDKRPATHALYGYVRTADELVDGPTRPATQVERRAALDAWEAQLDGPCHPAARALVDAAGRHGLPLAELGSYMRSMRTDCGPVRMRSWEELESYMDGSAGSVGRIMAALLEVPERHRAEFGRLGTAFQLTNFIRDVREDWVLDRVYLPAVDPGELERPRASRELRAAVAREVRRARVLFEAAAPGVAAAPARVRPGIRMACAAYGRVLDRVEAAGHDVLGVRTRLRALDVPSVVVAGVPG